MDTIIVTSVRDATDTVSELGLIAASVVSKKIAAGAQAIVLDVKCGKGAFFQDFAEAQKFCQLAAKLGAAFDRDVSCVISSMEQPLGNCVGNAIELQEAYAVAKGSDTPRDLYDVCLALGSQLLVMTHTGESPADAEALLKEIHQSGRMAERFQRWVTAQGGDYAAFEAMLAAPPAIQTCEVMAPQAGYVSGIDALRIGEFARSLGAGRLKKSDVINHFVGLEFHCKTGAEVEAGQSLCTIHYSKKESRSDVELAGQVLSAYEFSMDAPTALPTVIEVFS